MRQMPSGHRSRHAQPIAMRQMPSGCDWRLLTSNGRTSMRRARGRSKSSSIAAIIPINLRQKKSFRC